MSSTFHVPAIAMPRRSSSNVSAQDLLGLVGSDGRNGFLRRKHLSSIRRKIKWQHQFVVLAQTALYVFENEMSKSPVKSIPLVGYVAVEREVVSTCAWVFAIVPKVSSLPRLSFACSKDEERIDWMHEIKRRLYTANNVKEVPLSSAFKDKLKMCENMSPEERMYVELEFPIIPPDDSKGEDGQALDDDKDNDGIDDKFGKFSLEDDEDDDKNDDYDEEEEKDEDDLGVSTKSLGSNLGETSRQPDTPQGQGDPVKEGQGDSRATPPRYSAIVDGEEREYQNLGIASQLAKQFGLERACTILDETINKDRNACIQLLKNTGKIGTYLIRKSRSQDYKVLAVLAEEDTVKEYRIEESYGLFHFFHDPTFEFPSMESLLVYYSHHKPVPSLGTFLGWGVHECGVGDAPTYEEAC